MGKTFPVICRFSQYSRQQQIRLEVLTPRAVPWDFIAPHEAQAQRNHDQSLERLAQRGGLSPYEMVMCVRGRGLDGEDYSRVNDDEHWAHELLRALMAFERSRVQP